MQSPPQAKQTVTAADAAPLLLQTPHSSPLFAAALAAAGVDVGTFLSFSTLLSLVYPAGSSGR